MKKPFLNSKHLKNPNILLLSIFAFMPIFTLALGNAYHYLFDSIVIKIIGYMLLVLFLIKQSKKWEDQKYKLSIDKAKENPDILMFILMMIWMLISSILSDSPYTSFFGNWRGEGYLIYFAYAGFFIGGKVCFDNSQNNVFKVFTYIAYITSIPIIFMSRSVRYVDVIFHNSNYYGYYLTILMVLSAYCATAAKSTYQKIIHYSGFTLLSIALFVNRSRGSWIGLAFGIALFTILQLKYKKYIPKLKAILPAIILIVSFIAVDLYTKSDTMLRFISIFSDATKMLISSGELETLGNGRGALWKGAIMFTRSRPIFGHGIDTLLPLYQANNLSTNDRAHNEYLHYMATIGIPGLAFYLSALFIIIKRYLKNIKHASFLSITVFCATAAYLISALFGHTMPLPTSLFFLVLGYVSASSKHSANSSFTL